MTYKVSKELFSRARTPDDILQLPTQILEEILRPLGFYRKKAQVLQEVCSYLLEHHDGLVPESELELLEIPGVGIKTANLVRGVAFGIPAICVDVHVHRIANRLGLVHTKTPEQTLIELERMVPEQYWIELNTLFVVWGQNVCAPISPKCLSCPLQFYCQKMGVTTHR